MLDLFAELAHRRVNGGTEGGRRAWSRHFPGVRTARRPRRAGVPIPERPPVSSNDLPAGAPETLLGVWTEVAWRYCHAARGQEGARDPDEHPSHPA